MGRKNRRMKIHAKRLPTVYEINRDAVITSVCPRRLEIWYARLPLHRGCFIQGGARPVLVVSNNVVNTQSGAVTVLPLTSQMKKLFMPTHVYLEEGTHEMEKGSIVLAEQIMTVDKRMLERKIGELTDIAVIRKVEDAIREQLSIHNQNKENAENENYYE